MRPSRGKRTTTGINTEPMTKGKVKWYNEVKGFGFIATEKGEDIFVHRSGLSGSYRGLQPDQEVTFEIEKGEKGLYATNVKTV